MTSSVGEGQTNKWIVTVAVITGALMSSINMSTVNVALPYLRSSLGATIEEITWVATGYMLANIVMMPVTAMLSSRFGRKGFFLFSVTLFALSSMLCGLAWDFPSLVIFRIIQGIGGGPLLPIPQAILRETFPPEEQGVAMGIFGFGVVLGPAFGPTVGGWLIDHYSWPWIFYVNVPVGLLSLILVSRYVQDPPYLIRKREKTDFPGIALLILGLGSLQLMLERGPQKDWFDSAFIAYLAIASVAGLGLFIWRELTADKPAVNLRVFRNLPFASGSTLGGVMGMGLFGGLFLLPMFLQQLLDYPAFNAGLAMMPRSVAMAVSMWTVGRLYNLIGPRLLIGAGFALTGFSFWELSRLSLDAGLWDIILPQFWQGIGFGMIFVPLSTAGLSTIEPPMMTAATGLYNLVRQLAGSIGMAIAATQLTRGTNMFRAFLVENITEFRDATTERLQAMGAMFMNTGSDFVTARQKALRLLEEMIMGHARMLSFNRIFFLLACLFLLAIPLVFLLRGFRHTMTEKRH